MDMDMLNDPLRLREIEKMDTVREKQEARYRARFAQCVGIYLLLLGSAIAVFAEFGPWVTGMTNAWSAYICGAGGWLFMYAFLRVHFPRWTWNGYGTVTPIKKAMFVANCDTPLGFYTVKKLDWIATIFAGTKNPDGELPKKLVEECTNRIVIVPLDVTSDKSVAQAVETIDQHLKKSNNDLWAIVNNASVTMRGEVEWTPVDRFKQAAEVNVYGMVRITKAFLPLIRKNQGRIVNIQDMYGRFSEPGCAAYAMTKYTSESFSDALTYEMHQWGVKVCVVELDRHFAGVHDVIDARDQWERLDEKCQRHYGRSYYDDRIASWERDEKSSDADLRPVVDAICDAVFSRIPRRRYYVGGMKSLCKVFFHGTLPSCLTDKIIESRYSSLIRPTILTR